MLGDESNVSDYLVCGKFVQLQLISDRMNYLQQWLDNEEHTGGSECYR